MPELLKIVVDTATAFPTVVFTVLLGMVVIYWIFSMVTGGSAEGAIEGMTEGLFEGLAEGAFDGLADGALEGVGDAADGLTEAGDGTFARFFGCLGLTAVPLTLFMSILICFSWGLSILLSRLIGAHIGVVTTSLVVGSIVAVVSFGLAIALTAWAVRPLRPLFRSDKMISRNDLIGHVCTLTTLKVDEGFGMAEFDDGQAGLLLQVRCRQVNDLERGALVRIVGFDKDEDILFISPKTVKNNGGREKDVCVPKS